MKVIAWNVRGDGHPNFVSQVRKLSRKIAPDIMFLYETKVSANRSMIIILNFFFTVMTL